MCVCMCFETLDAFYVCLLGLNTFWYDAMCVCVYTQRLLTSARKVWATKHCYVFMTCSSKVFYLWLPAYMSMLYGTNKLQGHSLYTYVCSILDSVSFGWCVIVDSVTLYFLDRLNFILFARAMFHKNTGRWSLVRTCLLNGLEIYSFCVCAKQ